MSGLIIETYVSNLKSVALTVLELLAFNAPCLFTEQTRAIRWYVGDCNLHILAARKNFFIL